MSDEHVAYPYCIIDVTDCNGKTVSISSSQLGISNASSHDNMSINSNSINYFNLSNSNNITLNVSQLVLTDENGISNSLTRDGGLLTTNSSGNYISLNNTSGLSINGNTGFVNQVLTKNASNMMEWKDTSWVGTVTTNLNMNNFSIISSSLDSSATALTIGSTTSTSLILGNLSATTEIKASNLTINTSGTIGINGQVLKSNGNNAYWSDNWTSIASADLNMYDYAIVTSSLDSSNTSLTIGGNTASSLLLGNTSNITEIKSSNLTITASGTSGTSGQVLKSDGTYASWGDNWTGTATSDLNMSNFAINKITSINTDTILDISGQVLFNTPPHLPTPVYGNDGANKGYVDSLVGQYGGSLNLFFNKSLTSDISGYNILSSTPTISSSINVPTNTNAEPILVSSFITPQLNITSIPAGIWSAFIYGSTSNKNEVVYYILRIYTYTIDGSLNQIGDDNPYSTPINVKAPTIGTYYCFKQIPATPIASTTRIVVGLYIYKPSGGALATITTHFEGSYYSYISSTLNAGTTLLSSNNLWSGTNDFSEVGIKMNLLDSANSTLNIGTTTTTSLVLGKINNTTNIVGNVQINASSGSIGQILKSNGSGTYPIWSDTTHYDICSNLTSDITLNPSGLNYIYWIKSSDSSYSVFFPSTPSLKQIIIIRTDAIPNIIIYAGVSINNLLYATNGPQNSYEYTSNTTNTFICVDNTLNACNWILI
jgi:hypothetical protein